MKRREAIIRGIFSAAAAFGGFGIGRLIRSLPETIPMGWYVYIAISLTIFWVGLCVGALYLTLR